MTLFQCALTSINIENSCPSYLMTCKFSYGSPSIHVCANSCPDKPLLTYYNALACGDGVCVEDYEDCTCKADCGDCIGYRTGFAKFDLQTTTKIAGSSNKNYCGNLVFKRLDNQPAFSYNYFVKSCSDILFSTQLVRSNIVLSNISTNTSGSNNYALVENYYDLNPLVEYKFPTCFITSKDFKLNYHLRLAITFKDSPNDCIDCSYTCGNNVCDSGEDSVSCPVDCLPLQCNYIPPAKKEEASRNLISKNNIVNILVSLILLGVAMSFCYICFRCIYLRHKPKKFENIKEEDLEKQQFPDELLMEEENKKLEEDFKKHNTIIQEEEIEEEEKSDEEEKNNK